MRLHREVPVNIANFVRYNMTRLAGLISKEKNRRVVSSMFSSNSEFPEAPISNQLSDHLVVLERVIFDNDVEISQAKTASLISELEIIALALA